MDPDLRIRTSVDSPDARYETTDQKGAGRGGLLTKLNHINQIQVPIFGLTIRHFL